MPLVLPALGEMAVSQGGSPELLASTVPAVIAAVFGGAVFGVGMVLAGGCVTGTLFKSGLGHANSLLALPFVTAGLFAIDFGPLAWLNRHLLGFVLDGPDGRPLSLFGLTGIPHPALAIGFALVTLGAGLRARRRRRPPPGARPVPPKPGRWRRKPWRPWQAGVALGLLAAPAWAVARLAGRDFALGVTDGVQQVGRIVAGAEVVLWPLAFSASVVVGAHVAGRMASGGGLIRKPRERMIAAAIGGLLVGIGAGLGRGCVLGNGVTGAALMSVGMVLFVVVAMLANWVTTRVWLIGF